MGQLRSAEHDVTDGVDAGFGGLHPGIGLDEFAVGLDFGAFEADVLSAGFAADGDQNLFSFDFLLLAFGGDGDGDSGFRFFYFVDFRADVEIDAALAIDAGEFFRDFFVFDGNEARQHFDNRHFAIEGAIDGGELDSDGSGADNHQGLGKILQAEDFDVGEDAVAGLKAGDHAGFGAGREDYIFRFDVASFVVVHDFDGEYAVLRGAGELAIAFQGLNVIFLHQEVEAFGVLGDDLVLAILDRGPVELAGIDAFDAVFLGFFQMIPEFGVEKQSLGRDATHVQTGAAEESVFLNERGFQAVLAGADCSGVSGRSAADDSDVVDGFGQRNRPQLSV